MPDDACRQLYSCTGCGEVLRPRSGDCCVFCSYGTVACPPKQAREIEDRAKSGPLVLARDRLRSARRRVIQRGWQHRPIIAGSLRWIGKRLP